MLAAAAVVVTVLALQGESVAAVLDRFTQQQPQLLVQLIQVAVAVAVAILPLGLALQVAKVSLSSATQIPTIQQQQQLI
jgi:hypothetical protein